MEKNNEIQIKQKANFYYNKKLACHIILDPKGFLNGLFLSDIKIDSDDREYFNFEDQRYKGTVTKILMWDIFDIKDYEVKQW